ncbi:cytochrome c peroxidase [uncultured Desulfobacter sp.]|uniref:cytochrome c peroxidase n=1 Tax=uncultured Desulfobacter sp. TaxID=240139 RepID=UPI00374A2503
MFIFSCSNLFAGNSPFNELDDLEFLGKNLYNDKNLSINNNQSCKSCHHNKVAFVDPANVKKSFKKCGFKRLRTKPYWRVKCTHCWICNI